MSDPRPLWSRQPDEPAADYQLFAAWLQQPSPRSLRLAATALGCSLYRLRRLCARHRWKTRAAAFDHHRAEATSQALDELLRSEITDWQERARQFRLQEWLLHEQMQKAARQAVQEFRKHPRRASLTELAKLIDLASVLGRRACGLPVGDAPAPVPVASPYPDFEAALRKVYGSEAEIDAQPTLSPGEAAAQARSQAT